MDWISPGGVRYRAAYAANNNSENDDNWVVSCWRQPPPLTVTLLVVYKSCSQSPFASTIGFDLIGSNFYTNPHLPPTTLFMKREQCRNENEQNGGIFWKTSVCPMNIHKMRSGGCRERGDRTFSSRVLNCKTSKQGRTKSNLSGGKI